MRSRIRSRSLRGTITPPAPSTIHFRPAGAAGNSNASRAIRTPASRDARCGETGGSNRYRSKGSRSSVASAQARTDSRSVPSLAPVCTGFQYTASNAATRRAERTVFPTFVSVPVTKYPVIGKRKPRARWKIRCGLESLPQQARQEFLWNALPSAISEAARFPREPWADESRERRIPSF